MTNAKRLAERLRAFGNGNAAFTLADEVADLIERQAAEIEALRDAAPLCDKHKPNGGRRAQCLVCSGIALQAALSSISYLCVEPNNMQIGPYDWHGDESAVVEQVREVINRMIEQCRGEL